MAARVVAKSERTRRAWRRSTTVRSGLSRVVYALSTDQVIRLNPGSDWPAVTQDGPALFDEARIPIEEYYRPRPRPARP